MVDSEVLRGLLIEKGFVLVEDAELADIGIVNTCGFIQDAKEESIEYILRLVELKERGPMSKLIVRGCLSQRYPEQLLKEIPQLDAVFGVDEFDGICEFILQGQKKAQLVQVGEKKSFLYDHNHARDLLTPSHYAYVKIQEGCSKSCSYCAIPSIKGKSRSRDVLSVVEEVRGLIERRGVKEVVLIGQDTTSFGIRGRGNQDLISLLEKLSASHPGTWFRLLYAHPENFSDDIIELFAERENLLSYIDLPVQHINDRILRLMNRPVTSSEIRKLIRRIRDNIPGVVIRTSLICGFPSERESEFEELLEFVREMRFERLGAFMYSREEGTRAAGIEGQLSEKVKQKRYSAVMELQRSISKQKNDSLTGSQIQVMVDELSGGDEYVGRSYMEAPEVDGVIYIKSRRPLRAGEFVNVTVTGALEYDLLGEINEPGE